MIHYEVYPEGKRRAVTFSYDDGHPNDERLIAIFNKYNVKGTFHLNRCIFDNENAEERIPHLRKVYSGHEISCHTYSHGWPTRQGGQTVIKETIENRKMLEKIAGYPVTGMSYPFGDYNEKTAEIMRACGIVYSRTVKQTDTFKVPDDFMEWHPTCHQNDGLKAAERFMREIDSEYSSTLLYIWGHSHEFKSEEDWENIENIVKTVANSNKIWYATNIEIYDYITAQRKLRISYDENIFYNPSAIDVWVAKDDIGVIKIPAGQTVTL